MSIGEFIKDASALSAYPPVGGRGALLNFNDGTGGPDPIEYAATGAFDQIWTNRLTLGY